MLRPNQYLGCVQVRYLRRPAILGTLFLGLLMLNWLFYPRASERALMTRGGFQLPPLDEISNETILAYSQVNPAVSTPRNRIKFLLKETDNGKRKLRPTEAMESGTWKRPAKGVKPTRGFQQGKDSWMLPFTVGDHRHWAGFFQLAKAWFGDDDVFNPGVMQGLVRTVKNVLGRNTTNSLTSTEKDEGILKGKNGYQSCAVVGNSGILIRGGHGEQIDRHDIVIRLNNADVSRYKTDVGSKTTLSFMNSNVFHSWTLRRRRECQGHVYKGEVPIVLYICQPGHFFDVARCMSSLKESIIVTHSQFDTLCAAIAKWYSVNDFLQTSGRALSEWDSVHDELEFHYSSGMQAVVLALGLCDSVDMFGFGKFANVTHHYHTRRKEELSLHDYVAEYLFYDDLVHNRTVSFLTDAGISIPPVRIFY